MTSSILSDDNSSYSDENDEEDNDDDIIEICENCHRKQYPENNSFYSITFLHRRSDEIKKNKKFKTIRCSTAEPSFNVKLCEQCDCHLVSGDSKQSNDYNAVWPSFIWFILKNEDIHKHYGSYIWRFIPTQWRYWWISEVKDQFPDVYENVTIDEPKSIFIDRTSELAEWKEDIESELLSRLASCWCNKFMIPRILCPWGCSEFNHKCGFISLDMIYQRYLPKCKIKLIGNTTSFQKVTSARDDYIKEEGDEQEWLMNPDWNVMFLK